MAQLVVTSLQSPNTITAYINGLTNGWTDVLSVVQADNGEFLVISKA